MTGVAYGVSVGNDEDTINVVLNKATAQDVAAAIINGADRGPAELRDEQKAIDFARALSGFAG